MKPNIGQGDKGTTSLFGGKKVTKDHPQVNAYGNVDELNSYIGLILSESSHQEINSVLEKVQDDLFVIGSQLAASNENHNLPNLTINDVKSIEDSIQRFERDLPELKRFILPGGTTLSALLHIARTVCRRTEREMTTIARSKQIDILQAYINRLSDLLFALARYVNKKEGKEEKEWITR